MQGGKINIKALLVISVFLLMLTNMMTYVFLLSKNEACNTALEEKQNAEDGVLAATETFLRHVYYDGDSIPRNQQVRHYGSFGRFTGYKNLDEVLQGDNVVLFFPTNCSFLDIACDINKLQNLAKKIGYNHLLFIANDATLIQSEWSGLLDKSGYYETDMPHLGQKETSIREMPIMMLTQNGRIKTSFIVGRQTGKFADGFYKYIEEYFKEKK